MHKLEPDGNDSGMDYHCIGNHKRHSVPLHGAAPNWCNQDLQPYLPDHP